MNTVHVLCCHSVIPDAVCVCVCVCVCAHVQIKVVLCTILSASILSALYMYLLRTSSFSTPHTHLNKPSSSHSHPNMLTPSHTHTLTCSHLHTLTPSHTHRELLQSFLVFPHPRLVLHSHFPLCPLLLLPPVLLLSLSLHLLHHRTMLRTA